MKIKVLCFTAIVLLVAGPAKAQDADSEPDDAGTVTDAQYAEADVVSVGDGSIASDAAVADAELDAESDVVSVADSSVVSDAGISDAELDVATANDGEALSDAEADGSAGKGDGGGDGGGAAADAGPPPPPIHQFYNQYPGCSLRGAPDPSSVGGLAASALVALLVVRRRRASR